MKITCNIIEDLLPLYVDDMVSEDSRQLVEEHLKTCPACRKMQEAGWSRGIYAPSLYWDGAFFIAHMPCLTYRKL